MPCTVEKLSPEAVSLESRPFADVGDGRCATWPYAGEWGLGEMTMGLVVVTVTLHLCRDVRRDAHRDMQV